MSKVVNLHRKREEKFLPKKVYVTVESGPWKDSFLWPKELAEDREYTESEVYRRYRFLKDMDDVKITVKL